MRKNILLIGCWLCFMPLLGRAAQVELGLTAADRDVAPPVQTQPDATATKTPPQLGIGPAVTPAPAAVPPVVRRVIVKQRVVRVPAGRHAR